MPQKAPPIDAQKFLSDSQKRELAGVPPPYHQVAAWLLLIRDDRGGEWEQRDVKCIECTGQRVPCIDRINPGTKRRRCECCFLGDMKCSPGYERQTSANTPGPSTEPVRKQKRKLKTENSKTPSKMPKYTPVSDSASRSSASSSSASRGSNKRVKTSQTVIDLTSDGEGRNSARSISKRRTLKTNVIARRSPIKDGDSSSAADDSEEEDGESEREPPRLQMPSRLPRVVESGRRPDGQPHGARPSSSTQKPSRPRTGPPPLMYPPRVGTLKQEGDSESSATDRTASSSTTSNKPSVRLPFYSNDHIRGLIRKARLRTRAFRIAILVDLQEGAYKETIMQKHDFSIAVATPGNARTSTWVVTVIDHDRQLARVLFDSRGGSTASSEEEREVYVRFALEKAFDAFNGLVTVEAVDCPCLKDDKGGGIVATSIAIACMRGLPKLPLCDFRIDVEEALEDHKALQNNFWSLSDSRLLGPRTRVMARICKDSGQFEWM